MYEDASNQLGYFFELFSNQLALSPYGTEVGRSDATRRRSRTIVPEDDGMSSVQNRRKSTSCTTRRKGTINIEVQVRTVPRTHPALARQSPRTPSPGSGTGG